MSKQGRLDLLELKQQQQQQQADQQQQQQEQRQLVLQKQKQRQLLLQWKWDLSASRVTSELGPAAAVQMGGRELRGVLWRQLCRWVLTRVDLAQIWNKCACKLALVNVAGMHKCTCNAGWQVFVLLHQAVSF